MAKNGHLQVRQIYRLLQCVHQGEKVQIEKILNYGAEDLINLTEPQDGTGVLHLAAVANNQDLVSFLLSQGAQPNIQDKRGRTPVMLAAELGHDAMLTLLAKNRANFKILDAEGKGVLFYCICPTKRHARCLQVALSCQADVNNVSADGTHVFQLMCEKVQNCTTICLSMLDGGADPNATNQKTGATALMEAAKAGSLQLVRAILKRGGNPNALDRKRLGAVHYAAMGGFFEVIQVLSAYSADMGVISSEDNTALHYAAVTGHANCCKFLAQRGCNPKLKNQEGLLPRQIAKDAGHKAAAKELRKSERLQGKGSKPSSVGLSSAPWALTLHDWSQEHEAVLRHAFEKESDRVSTETFILVLQNLKAPVELDELHTVILAHDRRGEGFLSINEFVRGVKYIKKQFLLSSYGPKKKKASKGGKSGKKRSKFTLPMPICTIPSELIHRRQDGGPPHFLIETYQNCTDVSRFDRDHPPEHPIVDDSAWYLEKPEKVYININYCVKSGDLESLDLAFSQGVPVDVKDQFYKTPLMVACSSGNYEVAQYLLGLGADVNVCDQFCWTPLHHAAHAGQVDIIELLLKAGARIDAPALNRATPLMRAIESSRPSCVDFLIKAGANVMAKNKKDIARAYADIRIIDLIKDKMDSLPKLKETKKRRGVKPQLSKPRAGTAEEKVCVCVCVCLCLITGGKTNSVDISFVPKTVWGKPPTTSQLLAKKERQRERFSFEVDFEDFMMPFSENIQRKSLELPKTTG
uniref:Ankyrin repeat and EF-hand domain containing 1a n=1 Tax=Myripristis murdjan TaxID=586833 RepID=A0A667YUV7_9TELE